MRLIIAAALFALTGAAAQAACTGQDLFQTMPPDRLAAIEQASREVPFNQGLLFQAVKGDQRITLAGTYHFDDPRHAPMIDRLRPLIARAAALYVEAGPDEEARLTRALTDDPTLTVQPDGPSLRDRLSPDEWQVLSQAMTDRGIPGVVASRMRPWYVALMLGVAPCMMQSAQNGDGAGLDKQLVALALAAGTPVAALEPWDTIFDLFRGLTPEEEIDMIRTSLPVASYADDYAVTLTEAYFRGDVWQIWEFGRFDAIANSGLPRDQIDRQMDLAQRRLMDDRNRAWIAPLTTAADAAGDQGIVAAFGALHLPGRMGVLNLLQDQGYEITRLDGEAG